MAWPAMVGATSAEEASLAVENNYLQSLRHLGKGEWDYLSSPRPAVDGRKAFVY